MTTTTQTTDDNEFARYLASYLKQREYELIIVNWSDSLDQDKLEEAIKEFMKTLQ